MADTEMVPWRVWRTDGRYRLVLAANERQALRKVRRSVRADRAYDRAHPHIQEVA